MADFFGDYLKAFRTAFRERTDLSEEQRGSYEAFFGSIYELVSAMETQSDVDVESSLLEKCIVDLNEIVVLSSPEDREEADAKGLTECLPAILSKGVGNLTVEELENLCDVCAKSV